MGRPLDYDRPDGDGGPCCGAPAKPIATSRFAGRHRRGASFGSLWPCRRALDCERLDRQLRRKGWPLLADARSVAAGARSGS